MKLLLLHGPATNSSRTKLLEIKKKFDPENVIVFEKGADPKNILDTLVATPLFGENKLVLIENPAEDLPLPTTMNHLPYTMVLWFDHEIDPKIKGEVLFFPEAKEVSIFPFLDYLGNRDKKAFLQMDKLKKAPLRPFNKAQGFAGQGSDTQYIITMIFYLLRNLVYTPKSAKDFVKKKNAKMRANFSQQELVDLYKFVLETDFKLKSGLMESEQAEFSLVNLFCN